MESVKEKGSTTKARAFKGSISARDRLPAIAPEKEVQGAADLYIAAEKAEEPKAQLVKAKPKAAPVAPPEKRIKKVKFSVAIDPGDMALLRKAAKKAGKSVSLFVAELVGELVRK